MEGTISFRVSMPMNELEKLSTIVRLDNELNTIQDLDILLERILLEARKISGADAGSIYIRDNNKLQIKYSQNDTLDGMLPDGEKLIYSIFTIPIDEKTISGYVAQSGRMLCIDNVYNLPPEAPYSFSSKYDMISGYRTESMLSIPLRTNDGAVLGVLQIINKKKNGEIIAFNPDDQLMVAHFALNATFALQRAAMTRTIILRTIRMAELRDPKETGPHVNRVAGYAVELYERWATRRGATMHELSHNMDTLRLAAMLHDVGKVAIPDQILKKPGRFTPEEFEVMTTHTFLGARIFEDRFSELDEMTRIVALTHHENWDGSGYPGMIDPVSGEISEVGHDGRARRLKGEEIPIFGRIVALADVYDALRSQRVYKEAWREEDVLAEIKKLSGTKFDPEIVDIFFDALPVIHQIGDRYADAS